MSQRKKIYLEATRIIAILLVIFNHTDGFIYFTLPCSVITWIYSMFFAIICRVAVPLFFMVSGALLLTKEESFSKLIKRRIARILIVLAAISLLYYLFDIARGRIEGYGIRDFVFRLSTNGIRDSFWFLSTYISVLILLPIIRKTVLGIDKKLVVYMIGIKALTDVVLPLTGITTGMNFSMDFGMVIDCYYYVLLGHYLDKEEKNTIISGKKDIGLKELTFFLVMLVFLNGIFMYVIKEVTGEYRTELLDLFVFLTTPLVFLIAKQAMNVILKKGWECKWICTIGSCVFGIYLFDNFLRWQFLPVYLFLSEKTTGILANSVYILLTFSIGFAYTWVLRKIPVIRNYI
ncbi:O-acetyltransferase WecH [Lachnospiraceae bacterium]|nr:O-acetyltransferase WecH [Lachnospiraceae bacterium]